MEMSILTSTKKNLGIAEDYTVWDFDIITLINSAFSDLTQLGVGPEAGFMITDETTDWDAFIGDDIQLNSVKTYIHLKVKSIFDPPATSYAVTAMKEQIEQLEWRLNVHREETEWVDPDPPIVPEEVP